MQYPIYICAIMSQSTLLPIQTFRLQFAMIWSPFIERKEVSNHEHEIVQFFKNPSGVKHSSDIPCINFLDVRDYQLSIITFEFLCHLSPSLTFKLPSYWISLQPSPPPRLYRLYFDSLFLLRVIFKLKSTSL